MNKRMTLKRLVEQQEFYYDLGKDFQAFERTVDVSTEQAKEKFQKAMGSKILNNKVIVRASRGYKQPEKDYTIKKVTAINIDWYYTQYVVTIKDEGGKEYFLKPGFKIKVVGAPKGDEKPTTTQAPEEPTKAPEEPKKPEANVPPQAPPGGPTGKPTAPGATGPTKKGPGLPPPPKMPKLEEENKEFKTSSNLSGEDMKFVQNDLGKFFPMTDSNTIFDVKPYIVSAKWDGPDEDGAWSTEYLLQIPKNKLSKEFDPEDFSLDVKNDAYHYSHPGGQFSRGSVEIEDKGTFYLFRFYLNGGLDI
jgi:hypothetical protein